MADLFADSCLVLEAAGEPVGFLMSVRSGTTLFVWQIGIVPAHRGAGGSSLLYDALLTWARGAGVTGLTATIADDNEASRASLQSFCRRNGLVLRAGELVEIRDDADPAFLEVERRYAVAL